MATSNDTPVAKSGEVELQTDELMLTDVLKATVRNPNSPTRQWSEADKAVVHLASKADRGTAYCESIECKNPEGRTKLRGSRVAIGICSACQKHLER